MRTSNIQRRTPNVQCWGVGAWGRGGVGAWEGDANVQHPTSNVERPTLVGGTLKLHHSDTPSLRRRAWGSEPAVVVALAPGAAVEAGEAQDDAGGGQEQHHAAEDGEDDEEAH